MHRLTPLEKDYYLDHDDVGGGGRSEDEDDSGSSEDEVQRMFADIAGVVLPSQRKRQMKRDRSFEDEMESELNASFRQHNASWSGNASNKALPSSDPGILGECSGTSKTAAPKPASASSQKKDSPQELEGVDPALGLQDQGTESDEEFQRNEGLDGKSEAGDPEKLLYDPEEDDANQNWVDSHRRSYQPNASQHHALPKSDAVLNCPGCMTVLCLDCQRHEIYKTQYRAMFVMNCDVKRDELLFQPTSRKRGGGRKRKGDTPDQHQLKSGERLSANDYDAQTLESIKKSSRPEDFFHPVVCAVCKTEVGVADSDDVYHFFNILASYS